MATASWDREARVWDAGKGELLQRFQGHADRVEGLAFSPDGRRVLTGSLDGTVRLWDAATGKELANFHGHEGPVARVVFAPDGRTAASAGWDRTVRVWRMPSAYEAVVAWQVFPDAYQPPEKLATAVRRQVTLLDSPKYAAREGAAIVLRELGDEIVPLLLRIDPASLSPEQLSRVAGLLADRRRLTPAEAAGLRNDLAFLLDCLDADDAPVRRSALARLRTLTGAPGPTWSSTPMPPRKRGAPPRRSCVIAWSILRTHLTD